MKVASSQCTACGLCVPYCPVQAIHLTGTAACVDQAACVECGTCRRVGVCPTGALFQPELGWPRVLRARFSDPLLVHPGTGVWGRGTTEVKTADVSGHYLIGRVGIAIEVGRPGISASFADVEMLTRGLAGVAEFAPHNPVAELIDVRTGALLDGAVRGERVLSAIIEVLVAQERAIDVLRRLRSLTEGIDTVVTVGLIAPCPDGYAPLLEGLAAAGFAPSPGGKVNVGLGRPLA